MKVALASLSLIIASCSSNIYVVDEAGQPISGATVKPLSRGFAWPDKKTGKDGGVFVHQDIPTIDTVRAYKVGYHPSEMVNYSLPKPITITLRRR